jgi:hypothetical protein
MSWWETGDGNVIGDHPADLAGGALEALATARAAGAVPKSTLPEFLDALAASLRSSPPGAIDVGNRFPFRRVIAVTQNGARVHGVGATLAAADPTVAALTLVIGEIARGYQDVWGRSPRLAELLEIFLFVLGYQPDRYLSGAEGLELQSLDVE